MNLVLKTKTARAVEKKALEGVNPKYQTPARRRNLIRLAMKHGKCCHYCGVEVFFYWMVSPKFRKDNIYLMATFDHIIPRSKGGTYHISNGVLACSRCNTERGNSSVEKFQQKVENKGTRSLNLNESFKYVNRHQRRESRRAKKREKRKPAQQLFIFKLALLLYLHQRYNGEKNV